MLKFLNKRLNMLKILAKHADFGSRKALAEGLILSKIDYCVSLWGITTNGIIDKIQRVQNKAVRVVFGKRDYRAVTLAQLFKRLKWLKVKDTRNITTPSLSNQCSDTRPREALQTCSTSTTPTATTPGTHRTGSGSQQRRPVTTQHAAMGMCAEQRGAGLS